MSAPERVFSVCPHDCPSTCALEVERLNAHTVGRLHGAKGQGYTDGVICAKVARYAERVHHPERLATPLRRTGPKGGGDFAPISWDDALDEIAEGFTRTVQSHGAEAVWPYNYAGTMGLLQRDGLKRLPHLLGYSRQKGTICSTIATAGWLAGVGAKRGLDPREMAEAEVILIWGANPVHTQVNVMAWVAKAVKGHGAKLMVVDPYRTATAEKADLHLMLRPGTDGALAAAMMQVLLAEGLADRAYLARLTDFDDTVEAHLMARTPEWAAAITGIEAETIRAAARLWGSTKKAFLRLGFGFTRSRNGAAAMHAATCLPAVTGAWQVRGGGALFANSDIYPIDTTLITAADGPHTGQRELDMSRLADILGGDAEALMGGPPVGAMLVQNTNPAAVNPDQRRVRAGLADAGMFLAVHEQFMTETAALADIILPATTFLEHDDLYKAGGHTHLQVARPVIAPFAEARPNHEVHRALAARLGAEHESFTMSAAEIVATTVVRSGLPPVESWDNATWLDRAPDFETAHFLNGFGGAEGRFRFKADWARTGAEGHRLPALPDHWAVIEEADAEHPFRLVTAPARNFLNTTFTETATSRAKEKAPEVKVHPGDLAALGLADGAAVALGNRRGRVRLTARAFDGVQRGVLIAETIWPGRDHAGGLGINALTSTDSPAPNGGAVFHDCAVWLAAAPADAA
ncbi:molybdopterin-dependent oxidoreductase [Roseospirillum parvum]|uniref:Anaerobic selenocysteine-containing dehydrogenase n=1 Tax=Roseospirillum parvum TaxID=83401 RepID=A0A1G7WGX3_9PROT|nr:molybdopterin-dependent oxidoreductase [Roseospirillum parvum]SDG71233.1 Anaerobic selenocysteine-containing dehydrogenase [Roseospirillum parvum]